MPNITSAGVFYDRGKEPPGWVPPQDDEPAVAPAEPEVPAAEPEAPAVPPPPPPGKKSGG